jgi:hypothetical protein
MRTHLLIRLLLPTLLTIALLPGVATSAKVEASQAGAGSVDVCAALPREEAMKILGSKMLRARPGKLAEATECHYSDPVLGSITLLVETGISRKAFEQGMKELREVDPTLEPAGGVGDSGYFYDTRLYTYAGKYRIVVSTTPMPGVDRAKARANAVALAKALIARLK